MSIKRHYWEKALNKLGKPHWTPFIKSLIHLGQPSPVAFPPELMAQGVELLISGMNNTVAFQGNRSWEGPWWFEQQANPENKYFLPTGMNLTTPNLAYRNWTSIGAFGGQHEAMIDPVGSLCKGPYSWSVLPFFNVHTGDSNSYKNRKTPNHFSQKNIVQKRLACHAGVITKYTINPTLNAEIKSRAVNYNNYELLLNSFTIQNNSPTAQHVSFGGTIRPNNPLGIGHINKIKVKENV
jgi:hypothetical protein